MNKRICRQLYLLFVVMYIILVDVFFVNADDSISIPEPLKIVDFSYSFTELWMQDEAFEVVENAASPKLIYDEDMGRVLQLGKAVISNQEYQYNSGVLISDDSEYSTIKLTNPYKGLTTLKEYEPYEMVKKVFYETEYSRHEQPLWEQGITISYWIKTSELTNSNVLGFSSDRFQMQAADYAKNLTTYRFDLEYNALSEEEKIALGYNESGVSKDSDFYFEYAEDKIYNGKPLYVDEYEMGIIYWMNKNYIPGYVLNSDGTIKDSRADASYEKYKEAPYLGKTKEEHDPKTSNIRYGWTHSEMWLDASSSFYYMSDVYSKGDSAIDTPDYNKQLNSNVAESHNTVIGLDTYNYFSMNSWRGHDSFESAYEDGDTAPSPLSKPDKWHFVVCIIQNDWVRYYLDGKEIDILDKYSALGKNSFPIPLAVWKWFNKSTGARYGFGSSTKYPSMYRKNSYATGYVSPTILEWLVLDSTDMTIGGGNISGDDHLMFANTDEIMLKNIVFYDSMLTDEQIKILAKAPDYYADRFPYMGDANSDNKVTVRDALLVLKYVANIISSF